MNDDARPRLYGYFRSTAAYRVRIAANLKGVTVSHCPIHLRRGEQNGDQYLKLNSAGLVPYWSAGDVGLAQSLAIIAHLDETIPDPPLLPADARERGMCREISYAVCCDIHPIGNLRVLNRLTEMGIGEKERSEWSQHWIRLGFDAIEARLEGTSGPFAFGNSPSLADICIVPQVFNARRFGLDLGRYRRICEIDTAAQTVRAFSDARPERQPDAE